MSVYRDVGGDGRGGDEREHALDHRERVAGERLACPGAVAGPDEQQLAAALRQGEEEREQRRADEQPG